MSKIIVPILGEIEPGSSEIARQRTLYEKEKNLDSNNILESEAGRNAKAERQRIFEKAIGIKFDDPPKKPDHQKGETNLFESLKKQIADLEVSLKHEGITYTPLLEFKGKLESWSNSVSLKESDPDEADLVDEFQEIQISSQELADEVKRFKRK